MRILKLFVSIIFTLSVFHNAHSADDVIKLATIDWCPQVCPQKEKQGFIFEIFSEFAKSINHKVSTSEAPWSRAIVDVRKGEKDVLLSPTKREAPDLIYPDAEIGVQRMCFYGHKSNK